MRTVFRFVAMGLFLIIYISGSGFVICLGAKLGSYLDRVQNGVK